MNQHPETGTRTGEVAKEMPKLLQRDVELREPDRGGGRKGLGDDVGKELADHDDLAERLAGALAVYGEGGSAEGEDVVGKRGQDANERHGVNGGAGNHRRKAEDLPAAYSRR